MQEMDRVLIGDWILINFPFETFHPPQDIDFPAQFLVAGRLHRLPERALVLPCHQRRRVLSQLEQAVRQL